MICFRASATVCCRLQSRHDRCCGASFLFQMAMQAQRQVRVHGEGPKGPTPQTQHGASGDRHGAALPRHRAFMSGKGGDADCIATGIVGSLPMWKFRAKVGTTRANAKTKEYPATAS
jgi:hypothetical protein